MKPTIQGFNRFLLGAAITVATATAEVVADETTQQHQKEKRSIHFHRDIKKNNKITIHNVNQQHLHLRAAPRFSTSSSSSSAAADDGQEQELLRLTNTNSNDKAVAVQQGRRSYQEEEEEAAPRSQSHISTTKCDPDIGALACPKKGESCRRNGPTRSQQEIMQGIGIGGAIEEEGMEDNEYEYDHDWYCVSNSYENEYFVSLPPDVLVVSSRLPLLPLLLLLLLWQHLTRND